MAKITITGGAGVLWSTIKEYLNSMFTELYANKADKTGTDLITVVDGPVTVRIGELDPTGVELNMGISIDKDAAYNGTHAQGIAWLTGGVEKWVTCIDVAGDDLVLAYTSASGGDMLRLSQDGRMVFGPAIGTPTAFSNIFTIMGRNIGNLDGLAVLMQNNIKYAGVAIDSYNNKGYTVGRNGYGSLYGIVNGSTAEVTNYALILGQNANFDGTNYYTSNGYMTAPMMKLQPGDAGGSGGYFGFYGYTASQGGVAGNYTPVEAFRIGENGSIGVTKTITPTGTTGNRTIHKAAGRVNIAAAGTWVYVTNNLVTANSIVLAVVASSDTTAQVKNVVPESGAFTINMASAVTAETAINFLVIN